MYYRLRYYFVKVVYNSLTTRRHFSTLGFGDNEYNCIKQIILLLSKNSKNDKYIQKKTVIHKLDYWRISISTYIQKVL